MMSWICALLQELACLFTRTLVRAVRMTKRRYRECAVIVSFGVVLAVMVFCAGNFSGGGKNRVYAVQSSVQEEEAGADSSEEVKAGLMGIVDSVGCMEIYAREISSVSVQNGYENTLVGTSRVEKGALNRQKMAEELKKVSGVGYYGLMEIRNNQMPKQDYDALLRIVEAEATGGDLKSKVLIANVVLNRVNDERFPDSIYDVADRHSFPLWRTGGSTAWRSRKIRFRPWTRPWKGRIIPRAPSFSWPARVQTAAASNGLTAS